jgi:hypothetical protein
MNIQQLIEPLGIAAFISLLLTASFALFRRKNPRLLMKLHKSMALVTILIALAHAALVILGSSD